MRRFCIFFVAGLMVAITGVPAYSAVQIKKAEPVAPVKSSGSDSAASLIPTALGLVSNVMALNAAQNALSEECKPSAAEVAFVDNIMKEWAKTGASTADEAAGLLKRNRCSTSAGYEMNEQFVRSSPGLTSCLNYFDGTADQNMVWHKYPKVGTATICKTGANCATAKDKQTVSDIYDLFLMVGFVPADYLPAEATVAAKLLEKVERCAPSKITAKKRELWGEFLTTTVGGLGQKQNTGNIMESVGSVMKSGGGMAGVMGIASQFVQ